jgi:hypothetical protein
MVMEKEFIPYEQALALKELGFDEKCFNYYGKNNKLPKQLDCMLGLRHHSINKEFVLAPLYQQAFRWLLTLVNKDKLFSNKWTISYNEDYYSLFLGGCNMGVFEEELECFKKLIEIVKQK